jgi:pimeloyl-ACP methyl ester carboxylesterase
VTATVVLVHGAWHGAWCWDRVVDGLAARGVDAVAIDLPGHGASTEPLGDLHSDAAALSRALDALDGPVVLCGHSYGGAVIGESAVGHPNVRHLVFLAALMLDEGESCSQSVTPPPTGTPGRESELAAAMRFSDDGAAVSIDPVAGRTIFFHDCTDVDTDWAIARLGPQPAITLQQPVPAPAWRDLPSTYVVCTDDQAIPMWMQYAFAARATNSVEWPTSHSPFLSQPDLLVELLADLAAE